MPKIKSSAEIAQKWARVTPERTEDYKLGVENPKEDWAKKTQDAKEAYKLGIQESISKDRFANGVARVGTEKWKKKAIEKGGLRWGPGVSIAGPDYEAGFKPYADTIAATSLPPRYAKGDPRNIARVAAMAAALRTKKVSM